MLYGSGLLCSRSSLRCYKSHASKYSLPKLSPRLSTASISSMATQANFTLDSYSTAVVVIPPEPIQAKLNILRGAHDKSCPRWTAHFTLLFPFVAEASLADATSIIRDVMRASRLQPFQVTLDHVRFLLKPSKPPLIGTNAG